MSRVNVWVSKKQFSNYSDLVKFIKGKFPKSKNDNCLYKQDTIELLKSLKNVLDNSQHLDIYILLLKEGVQNNFVYHLDIYIEAEDLELIRAMLSCLITIADNSEKMCEAFTNTKLPFILINTTIDACSEDSLLNFYNGDSLEDIVEPLVLLMHYIARHEQFQKVFLLQKNIKYLKSQLMVYLESKDKGMVVLTLALLTWLAEDGGQDKFILGKHSYIIDYFTDHINKAMKDKGRRYEGLCVWELLLVLQSLSCMSTIEHSIFLTEKFMKMISTVLTSKSSLPKEIKIALSILSNLSFVDINHERMMKDFNMEGQINKLMHHSDEDIRQTAVDLSLELSKKEDKVVGTKQKIAYDVFISYCHVQNEVVKKLVEELKKKKFNVWVDFECIKGSGMDDMAKGIEKSRIFVMCVSSSYNESPSCKKEANYADRLKKPIIPLLMVHKYKPDGWLGMMISPETYIDVSNIDNIDKSVLKIEKHIHDKFQK